MCIVFLVSCNSINIAKKGDNVFHILDFNIEKVVGGIPSNSMTYNLKISLRVNKKTSVKYSSIQFGKAKSVVWILKNNVIISKGDVKSEYLKGERIDIFANFSGVNSSLLSETVDSSGVTFYSESNLIYEDSRGKVHKINLGQPDKVTNFLAQ